MGIFKKKETPEEKTARKEHEAAVKKAYDEAYQQAELEGAKLRGQREGAKAGANKQSNSLLSTIGRGAEGMLYGINKGADAFVKGVGIEDFDMKAPSGNNDLLVVPKGNNNLFFDDIDDRPKRHKRKVRRKEE